ncbi:conserved hypothetical protein [Altererythrobacter sp. B11]|uniref:ParB/RepB/Spo0J family partition protein n=1 Tax=Altererythrobacter sp. B11 TaxID=2060312 RepID=UPI000DC6E8BE|nr:ParB/RepB/Spo0J family partition protein [Altererythrobacter sp. B11]BBC72890.1 conserved hypothetical protein [Altererythrobacter sp. B11]
MTFRTFTHAQLVISPLNVRQNREDAEATEALEASILAHGLIYPLTVHPLPDGTHGVLAGGRRHRAIGQLIGRGDLPTDWPIDAVVRDLPPAEITELSLSENLLRRELRPYEVHAAIARARAQGASVEEIATRTGQRVEWVRQQLRLGELAPEIFAAYAEGQLSIDEARAYAATEDQELQLLAWRHLSTRPQWEHHANAIRAFLKIGDRELEKLLRFVGDEAYRSAGGRFELDLFADGPEERGRVTDETLLRQLAETRLAEHRDRIRQKTGRKDLRFAAAPPQNAGTTDWSLKLDPDYRAGRKIVLPAGDIVATIAIAAAGDVETSFWWASRKARKEASRAERTGDKDAASSGATPVVPATGQKVTGADAFGDYTAAQAARLSAKDEHGLTADGLQIVRSLRRMMLRNVLVFEPSGTVARDYLIWSLLRQELGGASQQDTGTRPIASHWTARDDEPADLVRDFFAEELVARSWDVMVAGAASLPFMKEPDPAASLASYVALDESEKNLCAGVLAGLALIRSANVPGWRVAAHDKMAELAGGSDAMLRQYWQPSPAFLSLFPKMKRLELAQPHVDADSFRAWPKLPDKTLSGAAAGALEHAEGDWMHPALTFNVAAEPAGEESPAAPAVADVPA